MTPDRLWITVRDGTRLAADLYVPTTVSHPAPALLEALPYRKDDLTSSSHAQDYHRLCAEGGFAVCRLDVRGTGTSEGRATDEYPLIELDDLADVIAWLSNQSWCNGRVGMFGYSYSGFNSLQVACERPPALGAVCAIYATDDRYTDDVHYMGGALRAIDLVDYCHYMTACNALPPVPALFGYDWVNEWRGRIHEHEPWVLRWLEEQHDNAYWRHGSLRPAYDRIECATMIVAGWADGYRNNTFRTFQALQCPKSLLVGPWSHSSPSTSLPGPHIDLVPEMISWFQRWLRPDSLNGANNSGNLDVAPIRVFMRRSTRPEPDRAMIEGIWRSETTWPPAGACAQTLTLASGGVDSLDVRADVGTAAWNSCAGGLPWGQPLDQRSDDAWSLAYDWPVVAPLAILGHPAVRVRVAADQPIASLSVKLCDVFPDGTSALVTRGFLNLTHRRSSTHPEPLVPGEFEDISIELEATSWVFASGHRLRLAVNGVDWPNTWVPPEPFTLQLERGSLRLQLPVIEADGTGVPPFTSPSRDVRADPDRARPDRVAQTPTNWTVEHDILRRTTIARTSYGGPSAIRDGGSADELYEGEVGVSISNPADSWATARTRYQLVWPEATCVIEARMRIRSDRVAFDVEIELDADLDGNEFARRVWQRRIPRRLL